MTVAVRGGAALRRAYLRAMRLRPVLLALTLAAPAAAQEATVETYPVTGSTYRELLASMRENGPVAERTGRRHFGVTRIAWSQSWEYQRARGRCELLGTDIDLKLTIVLPEWTDREGATARTLERWERLYDDIVQHEERHAAIAREYLAKLRAETDRPVSAPDCPALEAGVKASSRAILRQHRNAQRAFDGLPPIEG